MNDDGWIWKVGILNGIGESMWEEKDTEQGLKLRKITKFIWDGQRQTMIFVNCMVGGGLLCMAEIFAGQMILASGIPDESLVSGASMSWKPKATILRAEPKMDLRKIIQFPKGGA